MTLLQRHFFSFFYSSFHQTFSSKMTSIWFWGSIFWKCDNFLVRWHCSNSQPLTWPVNKSSPSVVANHFLSSRGKATTSFPSFFFLILSFYWLWKSLANVIVQLWVRHSPWENFSEQFFQVLSSSDKWSAFRAVANWRKKIASLYIMQIYALLVILPVFALITPT